ncbi:MAG: AmmeMemoRadiSam system radical SAM enzyme [Victivallales bacterium]|jgi:pyruvate formate lyase activating enzyme|nr:AmmeMemoRadiSam system radical SAM enzyme [Victivallales bacterium]
MSSNPARFYTRLDANIVRCDLCPRLCEIVPGGIGWCNARCNEDGELLSLGYARPVAVAIDPIEKKPLMDFLPQTQTLSLGTYGCNLDCCFCQNSSLSRGIYNSSDDARIILPVEAVSLALANDCPSISLTYNEPTICAEYAIDIAKIARRAGLKTILVTNGFIAPDAARELYKYIDAANIDVKGFSEEFYSEMCRGTLAPVKTACEIFKNESGGHLELTNLVIPGKNDSPQMIADFLDYVESALGLDTPLHFNAYFPAYHYRQSPRTPATLLRKISDHAHKRGFTRVQIGNI